MSHIVIKEKGGIYARPAGLLVNAAKQYESNVVLVKGDKSADIKRILSLIAFGIKKDKKVTVQVLEVMKKPLVEELEKFSQEN